MLTGASAAHLISVLRVAPGQAVRIGVIDGPLGIGTVGAVQGDTVTLTCVMNSETPPRPSVDLLLALPRPKVMRRLWAQLAALGVYRIILTNAERVERNYFDTHVLSPESFRPLLIEGLQQAKDTRLPVVSVHRQFRKLIEAELDQLSDAGTRIVADPSHHGEVRSALDGASRVLLAIGPEGGWNAFERDLLRAHRFQPVDMGPRTLRSDTACIALIALVTAALGR